MTKTIGIYKITSPSGKIYIGQSIDIIKRWGQYSRLECKKQIKLYNSLKKYGYDKHLFEIVCQCSTDEVYKLEKEYVNLYGSFNTPHALNLSEGGIGAPLSKESRQKISLSKKGIPKSEAQRKKMSELRKGTKLSEEHKKRIGEASKGNKYNLGRVLTEEHKNKIRNSNRGKIISEEQKEKIRNTLKGHTVSKETREKISKAGIGRKASEETKEKLREVARRRKDKILTSTSL